MMREECKSLFPLFAVSSNFTSMIFQDQCEGDLGLKLRSLECLRRSKRTSR
jgi:hypothetical protein